MTDEHDQLSRAQRVSLLLEDRIRSEIEAQLGMSQAELPYGLVGHIAAGVVAEVQYAFDVDWNPDWVAAGGVHSWEESGKWFARCGVCLLDSHAEFERADAESWARRHEASHRKYSS